MLIIVHKVFAFLDCFCEILKLANIYRGGMTYVFFKKTMIKMIIK